MAIIYRFLGHVCFHVDVGKICTHLSLSKAEGQKREKLSVKFANTLLTTCACCCRVREEDVSNAEFFTAHAHATHKHYPCGSRARLQDLENGQPRWRGMDRK